VIPLLHSVWDNGQRLSAYISDNTLVIPERKIAMNTISLLADRMAAGPEIPSGAVKK